MTDIAISVEGLSKRYRIVGARARTQSRRARGVQAVASPFSYLAAMLREPRDDETVWALRDITFDVPQGELVGIIGRNGAGKSTLLKVLSRITEPTEGRATMKGRLGSLLEVGAGFHPELSGRDNVYLNGAVLGMRRAEIQAKFDEIVEFSEIGAFIDTPVKRYSSGMYLRLAFAVAAHLDPDILIVDEALAVGDIAFRRKSLGRLNDVSQSGKTVLFVSHDMNQIRSLCQRVIWLDKGGIRADGPSEEVCRLYEAKASLGGGTENPVRRRFAPAGMSPGPKIEEIALRDADGRLRSEFSFDETIDLHLRLAREQSGTAKEFSAIWFLHNEFGQQVAIGSSFPISDVTFKPEVERLVCRIGPLNLPVGAYSLRIVLHVPSYDNFDDWPNAISFRVGAADVFGTGFDYPGIHSVSTFVPYAWSEEC